MIGYIGGPRNKELHLNNQQSVAVAARPMFESLKNQLEAKHWNKFVAIEPVSGEFFVGETMSEAIGDSRRRRLGRAAAYLRRARS